MTQEELERLEKGKQMRDDIEAHKRMISLMEEAINLSDDVRSAMIVINKDTEAPCRQAWPWKSWRGPGA